VLIAAFLAVELPMVIVNPRRVRLPDALGEAKTDEIDARMLARFGERTEPPLRELADEQTQSLRTLWVRREQLLEMLVMEENRLEHAPVKAKGVRHNLRSHYRTLLPWHLHFLPKRRESVTYVSGYVLLPMCRVGHLTESGTI
jgi:transposase